MFRAALLILVAVVLSGCAGEGNLFQRHMNWIEVNYGSKRLDPDEMMPGCKRESYDDPIWCPWPGYGRPVGHMGPDAHIEVVTCDLGPRAPAEGWDCRRDPKCRLVCSGGDPQADRPRYSTAADPMCPNWPDLYQRKQVRLIHEAFADTFVVSPEALWCLTNSNSVTEQVEAFTSACASGVEGSGQAVFKQKLIDCGAWDE